MGSLSACGIQERQGFLTLLSSQQPPAFSSPPPLGSGAHSLFLRTHLNTSPALSVNPLYASILAAELETRAADAILVARLQERMQREKLEMVRRYLAAANRVDPVSSFQQSMGVPEQTSSTGLRFQSKEKPTFPSERNFLPNIDTCKTTKEATKILRVLGSTLRSKADKFYDVSSLPSSGEILVRRETRGAAVFFPDALYRMLVDVEKEGLSDIVSFLPHGRAFRVHKKDKFVTDILPKYFTGQRSWGSFTRQLNNYGFLRVTRKGVDQDSYYHELFLRGRPRLCQYMERVGRPHGLDRRTFKLAEGEDPDFYSMPPVEVNDEAN